MSEATQTPPPEPSLLIVPDNESTLKKESLWSKYRPRSCWGYSWISKKIPITKWIFKYSRKDIFYDLIAGLTVTAMAIPQSISRAAIAGLPPQRGLYTEIFPGIVYLLFGSTAYTIISSTSLTAHLFKPVVRLGKDFGALLTLLNGIVIFCLGLLQLGFIVDFISLPVIAGFVSAAAISIITQQFLPLTGITTTDDEGVNFIESGTAIINNFKFIRCADTLTGILTILLLVGFQFLEKIPFYPKLFNVISKSRYLVLIVVGTLISHIYENTSGEIPFYVTGSIVEGTPPFAPPPISTTLNDNHTVNFFGMVEEIGLRVITIPIVSVLHMFIVSKVFAEGENIQVNQELMTLGVINVCGSFLAAIPTSGSFSRTAVNISSGVRSPFSGLLTPIVVMIALYYWSDSFYYIPKAVLAAMIICAMWPLIDIQLPIDLWVTKKKKDLIPLIATFLICLIFGTSYGILSGVTLNLFIVLHRSARPTITCELFDIAEEKVLVMSPYQNLYFPAAKAVLDKITKCAFTKGNETTLIIVNGHLVKRMDASVAETFAKFYQLTKAHNKKLVFWNWESHPKAIIIHTEPRFELLFRDSENLETLLQQMDITVPIDLTSRPFYHR